MPTAEKWLFLFQRPKIIIGSADSDGSKRPTLRVLILFVLVVLSVLSVLSDCLF